MHTCTSSSSRLVTPGRARETSVPARRAWAKAWVSSAFAFVLSVIGFDLLGGAWDIPASLHDEPALWAVSRERIERSSQDAVVLVGASRSAFGTDLRVIEEALSGVKVTQLAIRGANWTPVLADLARQPPAGGWVIISLAGPSLETANVARAQAYVGYYRSQWKPALAWEREVDTWIHLRNRAPGALDELTRRIRQLMLGTSQWSDRSITSEDRQVRSPARQLRKSIEGPALENRRSIYERQRRVHALSPREWRDALEPVLADVDRLRARGVEVAFVRYPSSEPHRSVEQAYYPRAHYWDVLASECERRGCTTLHFEDVPRLRQFVAEDGSHLPHETRGAFTSALVKSLREVGFLE